MTAQAVPPRHARKVVVTQLACQQCRYDLRGLRASGVCPECGSSVWKTVSDTIDPDASKLPPLHNPATVGNALLALSWSWLIAALAWCLPELLNWISGLGSGATGQRPVPLIVEILPGLAILSSGWAAWRLTSPVKAPENLAVRVDLFILVFTILTAAGLLIVGPLLVRQGGWIERPIVVSISFGAAMMLAMWSLRRIVQTIGKRSRQWRTARGGRQRIVGLMLALALAVVGTVIREIPDTPWSQQHLPLEWSRLGDAFIAIGMLMLLIGLVYFVVNMHWISRSLHHQPPTIGMLLRLPEKGETVLDPPADDFQVKGKGDA